MGGAETFYAVFQSNHCALVAELNDLAFHDRVNAKLGLKLCPRILLKLFVTEAETAVLLINVKNNNLNLRSNLRELVGVFDFLGPAQIAYVD